MKPICTTVEQISIMVRDVHEAVRLFTEEYGVGPWRIVNFGVKDGDDEFNSNTVDLKDVTLHGKYVGAYAVKIGICEFGDFQLELIEPLDEKCLFGEYLRDIGPGCEHMAIDSTIPFQDALGLMAKNGFPLSQLAKVNHDKEDCAFVDHRRLLGLDIELHYWPAGHFEFPPVDPERYKPKEGSVPLFDKVEQIAFVVNDVRETVKLLNDEYGIGPWFMINFGDCHDGKDFIPVEDAVIDGVEIGTYGVHMAACNSLNVQIELLEPTGEDDALGRFLKERGPGLHHISIRHEQDFETVSKRFRDAGYTKGQTARIDGHEICGYVDHMDLLGIYLEIHHRDEKFEWPKVQAEFYPPDQVIPVEG